MESVAGSLARAVGVMVTPGGGDVKLAAPVSGTAECASIYLHGARGVVPDTLGSVDTHEGSNDRIARRFQTPGSRPQPL